MGSNGSQLPVDGYSGGKPWLWSSWIVPSNLSYWRLVLETPAGSSGKEKKAAPFL
ncbi:MAG: hypothetical protein RBR88_00645 [Candidatus Saccharicenans sp.]|nr:hypothetical protein [Candidatus Saccharicenans sp.]